MVKKEPYFSEQELGHSINPTVLGKSTQTYDETLTETDVVLVHGAPDEYEMNLRFKTGESDLLYLDEDNLLQDTTLVMFEDEYKANSENADWLEENLETDVVIPEEDPETTIDDWKHVEAITSSNDTVRSYTSDYHAYKAHKTSEYAIGDRQVTILGAPTNKNTLRNRVLQNGDALTRQRLLSWID